MNGVYVGQYCLNVKLADRDKDRGMFNQPSTNLYVSNLPLSYGVTEISALFAPFGAISSMVVLTDPHSGGSRGVGLVRYYSVASATSAIELLNGRVIHGHDRPLEVKFAENQEEKHLRKSTIHKNNGFPKRSSNLARRCEQPISCASSSIAGSMLNEHLVEQINNEFADSAPSTTQSEVYGVNDHLADATSNMTISKRDGVSAPLYVYGIDTRMKELELYKLFAPYGAIVSVKMESKGIQKFDSDMRNEQCCAVQFREESHAVEALKGLNGMNVGGKVLSVVSGDTDPSLLPAGA
jgi:RNA recognition motif-containing protein